MDISVVKQIIIEKNGGFTMDVSAVFQLMLDKAIGTEPSGFVGFDRTKNVQDQLQEMAGYIYDIQMIRDFLDFITSPLVYETINGTHYYKLNSTEQLWLAFVMKEKYHKTWDGGEWRIR